MEYSFHFNTNCHISDNLIIYLQKNGFTQYNITHMSLLQQIHYLPAKLCFKKSSNSVKKITDTIK